MLHRKTIIAAVLLTAGLLAASCVNNDTHIVDYMGDTGRLRVSVTLPWTSNAQEGYSYETALRSEEIFIFNSEGKMERRYYFNGITDTPVVDAQCSVGEKTVYVILNASSFAQVSTMDDLKAATVALAENSTDGETGALVLTGKMSAMVEKDNTKDCQVAVGRRVCRLVVEKITNALPEALGTLTVKGIFVVNGGADMPVDPEAEALADTPAYNAQGYYHGSPIKAECDSPEDILMKRDTHEIPVGATLSINTALYAYPHTRTGIDAMRIAVLASIDGIDYYYPATIYVTRAGASYSCNISIKGCGTYTPNAESTGYFMDATVWEKKWKE